MNAETVSIGHELLMGEIVDTNSSFFAQRLAEAGIPVRWMSSVGDDLDHICEALQRALARSDVIITSGGLGPTSDDLTREAVATVVGEKMVVDAGQLAWLQGVFQARGLPMPRTNIKQATLIPSATPIPNPTGTAPGWWVTHKGRQIVLTPGPPREIQRMWQETIGPRLASIAGAGVVFCRTLKTYGISEGAIDETLHDLFGKGNPYLGIYARPDGIHLRIIVRAPDTEEAVALAEPIEREISGRLGAAVWGTDEDTPASLVINMLRSRGRTLSVADDATGGTLSALLCGVTGHADVFKGAIVNTTDPDSPNHSSTLDREAGGEAKAVAAARAVRLIMSSDIGVSVVRASGSDAPHPTIAVAGLPLAAPGAARQQPPPPTSAGSVAGGLYFAAVSEKGIHSGGESRRWPREVAFQRAAVMALVGLAGAIARSEI